MKLPPNNIPKYPWGKYKSATKEYHTVVHHSLDVAALAKRILEIPLVQKRLLKDFNGVLSEGQIAHLVLIVYLHDVGKYTAAFQDKRNQTVETFAPHTTPGLFLFEAHNNTDIESVLYPNESKDKHPNGRPLISLDRMYNEKWFSFEGTTPKQIAKAILGLVKASISHHGKPETTKKIGQSMNILNCWLSKNGSFDLKVKEDIQKHIQIGCGVLGLDKFKDEPTLKISNEFLHFFMGLTSFADWGGSDTDYFPYHEDLAEDTEACFFQSCYERFAFATTQAEKFLKNLGWLDLDRTFSRNIFKEKDFRKVFPFESFSPEQQKAIDAYNPKFGMTEIFELMTGSGKTEIAITRAVQYVNDGYADAIAFLVPSIASAEQLYNRIVPILQKFFPNNKIEIVFAIGSISSTERKRMCDSLQQTESNLYDDQKLGSAISVEWSNESSKKFFASTFFVGTIDQALKATLQLKHAEMIYFLTGRYVLIFDEVHASDTYTTSLLSSFLDNHRRNGGISILLSATLTDEAKAKLLGIAPQTRDVLQVPYPLLTQHSLEDLQNKIPPTEISLANLSPAKKELDVILSRNLATTAIVEHFLGLAQKGAKAIMIANTRVHCIEIQKELEKQAKMKGLEHLLFKANGIPTPFHSQYATNDRSLIAKQLEISFGKNAQSDHGVVLVATQVVQQSLDIDCDVMGTTICPMDDLLQRFGRLHRHNKTNRPKGFEKPIAYVFAPQDLLNTDFNTLRLLGLGSVYGDFLSLAATIVSLEEDAHISIPKQARYRMEKTLSTTDMKDFLRSKLGADTTKLLIEKRKKFDESEKNDRYLAESVVYKTDNDYCNFVFDQDVNDGKRITTRLGEDQLLVGVLRSNLSKNPILGVFGGVIEKIAISVKQLKFKNDAVDIFKRDLVGLVETIEGSKGSRSYRIEIKEKDKLKGLLPDTLAVFEYSNLGLIKMDE